jgi:hypothetical protein
MCSESSRPPDDEPPQGGEKKLPAAQAKRLAWALNEYGQLLTAAVREDTSPEARRLERLPDGQIPAQVARLIQDKADPTVAKTMTGWLVRQYAEGALRLEDTGTAHETLEMFQRHARRLPKGKQDLGQYQSVAKVWEVVSPIAEAEQDKLSGKAQKAMDKSKAYAESRILRQDEDGFTVAVPLTEFAAKWWGKGTRWCTAAEKDNRFWYYHKDAPLIVIVIPELKEQGKFQLWFAAEYLQFMDAGDRPVSNDLIAEHWARFEPILIHAMRQTGSDLKYVPKHLRTEELCRVAVEQDGWNLLHVPEYLLTKQLCGIAVAQNGTSLKCVPQYLQTEGLYRLALEQTGLALGCVPKDSRTEEMCRIAVARDGWSLQHVPDPLRNGGIYREAVSQNGTALFWVPKEVRTEPLCHIAVTQNGNALEWVPVDLRTEELCRIAVEQSGLALEWVPTPMRKEEMCRIAVAQNGLALEYVPHSLRTEDLFRIAIEQDGCALWFMPSRPTEEMCRIAVAQNREALESVPEDMRAQMQALIPDPDLTPVWDLSLLNDLVVALAAPIPLQPSVQRHE